MTDHASRAHAVLSASGSAMWLACPPSARLNEAEPEETSEYAAEGTLGHELVENELAFLLGMKTQAQYEARNTELWLHPLMNESLDAAVTVCVQRGWGLIEAATAVHPDALILLEQRLDFSRWVPEGFGTGDLVIVTSDFVQTVDWKFGMGEWVEAAGNTQLRLYAAAALDMYGAIYGAGEVRATVVQPRVGNFDTEVLSAQELLFWAEQVAPIARTAWEGEGAFNPGAKQCRWCKVRGKCRARAEANLAVAQQEFTQPALMSDDEIAALYPQLDEIVAWAQDVAKHADKRVLAGGNLAGLKAVEGRSSRVITDPARAYTKLCHAGFSDAAIMPAAPDEVQLLPITQLEKVVGAALLKEILGDLIVKPPGKVIVVPSHDKRIAIDMSNATPDEDFGNE